MGRGNESREILARVLKDASWVYFIGIKGTGMCALAELMHNKGIHVSGSDRDEVFYTDAILGELGIQYYESFEASHLSGTSSRPDAVVYSAAYSAENCKEIEEAERLNIPMLKYSDALGAYSAGFDSTGITGVHGKTTTTALAGTLLRGAGVPAQILVGSSVSTFGNRSTLSLGNAYFVAETCEYRRHFLSFHPRRIILTSVESDHQDYYPEYKDIKKAFLEYGRLLPSGGELIYCADDPGAAETAAELKKERKDIILTPYGFSSENAFKIEKYEVMNERTIIRFKGFPGDFKVRIPGRHTALNAAAALALVSSLVRKEYGNSSEDDPLKSRSRQSHTAGCTLDGWNDERMEGVRSALEEFSGSKRRSEILGEACGVLFMDDYGHHPTAIKTTLEGLKEFYPGRRLVLSFMSHTYTRTSALLEEFAASFEKADLILLHKIYASAREVYHGGVTGRTLFEKTKERLGNTLMEERFFYAEEPDGAFELLKGILRQGDLFITMGAGNNWTLGKKLFGYYSEQDRTLGPGGSI